MNFKVVKKNDKKETYKITEQFRIRSSDAVGFGGKPAGSLAECAFLLPQKFSINS